MAQLPMIKVLGGPSQLAQAVSSPTTKMPAAPSRAAELIPFDPGDLMQFLSFRIAVMRMAAKRQSGIFGRLYNRLSGEDPNYTQLSGTHLKQTLTAAGVNIPDGIKNTGDYKLRGDICDQAMAALEAKLAP